MTMDLFLPGLPVEMILAAYAAAPGNEIASGKFKSPESSAALVANSFGLFLDRPADLPPLPGFEGFDWRPQQVRLEALARFPWPGGRHPCLDVLVETKDALIGIESKRYEAFRGKVEPDLSKAYWRPVWGESMAGFERVRNGLRDRSLAFVHLDATQLVKHAFGLRTAVHRNDGLGPQEKRPLLYYLYAEPESWPKGSAIPEAMHQAHRSEVLRFGELVAGDEVCFRACSYGELLATWEKSDVAVVRAHVTAVRGRFDV